MKERKIDKAQVKKIADKVTGWMFNGKNSLTHNLDLIAKDPDFKNPIVRQSMGYLNLICIGLYEAYWNNPIYEHQDGLYPILQKVFIRELKKDYAELDRTMIKIGEAPRIFQITGLDDKQDAEKVEESDSEGISTDSDDEIEFEYRGETLRDKAIFSMDNLPRDLEQFQRISNCAKRLSKVYDDPLKPLIDFSKHYHGEEKAAYDNFILNYSDMFVEFARMFMWEMLYALPRAQRTFDENLRLEKEACRLKQVGKMSGEEIRKIADKIAEWTVEGKKAGGMDGDNRSDDYMSALIIKDYEFKDPIKREFTEYLNLCCLEIYTIFWRDSARTKEEFHIFNNKLRENLTKLDALAKLERAPQISRIADIDFDVGFRDGISMSEATEKCEDMRAQETFKEDKIKRIVYYANYLSVVYNDPCNSLIKEKPYIYASIGRKEIRLFLIKHEHMFAQFLRAFMWEMLDALPRAQCILEEKQRLENEAKTSKIEWPAEVPVTSESQNDEINTDDPSSSGEEEIVSLPNRLMIIIKQQATNPTCQSMLFLIIGLAILGYAYEHQNQSQQGFLGSAATAVLGNIGNNFRPSINDTVSIVPSAREYGGMEPMEATEPMDGP